MAGYAAPPKHVWDSFKVNSVFTSEGPVSSDQSASDKSLKKYKRISRYFLIKLVQYIYYCTIFL